MVTLVILAFVDIGLASQAVNFALRYSFGSRVHPLKKPCSGVRSVQPRNQTTSRGVDGNSFVRWDKLAQYERQSPWQSVA
jgi:hypothetical protein